MIIENAKPCFKITHYSVIFSLLFLFLLQDNLYGQEKHHPKNAFLRSMVIPGWGHYYINKDSWRRGQIHLGTELILIATYFGLSNRSSMLESQYETLALLKAGIDITGRSRTLRLALGDFNSLEEYNDFQLRSRNWNMLFKNNPENNWNWESVDSRNKYNDLQTSVDRVRNQLPAILSLMVLNRVISAVSSYNRAKNSDNLPEITLMPISFYDQQLFGIVGTMNIRF